MLNEGNMCVRVGEDRRVNLKKYTRCQNAMMVQGMPWKKRKHSGSWRFLWEWVVAAKHLESKL